MFRRRRLENATIQHNASLDNWLIRCVIVCIVVALLSHFYNLLSNIAWVWRLQHPLTFLGTRNLVSIRKSLSSTLCRPSSLPLTSIRCRCVEFFLLSKHGLSTHHGGLSQSFHFCINLILSFMIENCWVFYDSKLMSILWLKTVEYFMIANYWMFYGCKLLNVLPQPIQHLTTFKSIQNLVAGLYPVMTRTAEMPPIIFTR